MATIYLGKMQKSKDWRWGFKKKVIFKLTQEDWGKNEVGQGI